MTTPNNQPTPPEGYRLLTPEERIHELPEGTLYQCKLDTIWRPAKRLFAADLAIYAIPITVPATGDKTLIQAYVEKHGTLTPREGFEKSGDTTNEKGGEPCRTIQDGPISASSTDGPASEHHVPNVRSNAAVAVQSHDQRQDFQWDEGKHAIRELGTSHMDAIQKRFGGRKDAKPVEQRQNKAFLEAAITEQIAQAEHWKEHYTADPKGKEYEAYWNGRHTAFQEAMNLIQSVPIKQRQELLPCPFCGSHRIHRAYVRGTGCSTIYMQCGQCNAQGPWSTTEEQLTKWNTRK